MEKFGLFRLLSALTGETAAEKEAPDARSDGADAGAGAADGAGAANEAREAGALAQPAGGAAAGAGAGGIFSGEERRRRAEQILARHEAVSRRIDRRGKT